MNLSNRIRPDVEAAPWVIEEIKKLERDAARYQWLTADHDEAEMRDRVEDMGIRLRWIGKGAADAAIDAAMKEATNGQGN